MTSHRLKTILIKTKQKEHKCEICNRYKWKKTDKYNI